jgi:5S rRNA maturation endonuclease (ribonuclease M5)
MNKRAFKRDFPCPICGGHNGQQRGQSKRCYGFLSGEEWAHCTREEYAGGLSKYPNSDTFGHKLFGNCNCGIQHNSPQDDFGAKFKIPGIKNMKTKIIATYDYLDERGELLYQVCRKEPKGFIQRQPLEQGGWKYNLGGVRRVLYRLPELLASNKTDTVFVCEGEKDVDALRALGLVATTNAGGAGKWKKEYNTHLRGRYVVILPDNDETGQKHAESIAHSLSGIAANVKVITLPSLSDKGDVSDWLDMGGSARQLNALSEDAPLYEPSSSNSSNSQTPADDNAEHKPVAFPTLDRTKALYGLAGNIVRAIEPHSEADPTALLVQLLVAFGNVVGRTAYFVAEADRHYTNLFTVIVGDSSRGRKGSSLGYIRRLIEEADENWAGSITGGLTSGEGLVHHVRDEDDSFMPGAIRQGKKALVVENEFASVLKAQSRQGNTLSTLIRQAWDTGNLNVMRRESPDKATNAHISIIAHITGEELKLCLQGTDTVNGYANRFLWVASRRSKKLPEGGYFNLGDNAPLVARFREAVEFAGTVGEMKRDEEARELWLEIYDRIDDELPSGRLEAILSRAEAQIMRLACVYALLDCSTTVRRGHLEAAKAVWDYSVASARYVFGNYVLSKKAQKFLDLLTEAGTAGLNKTELFRKNGGRSDALNESLEALECAGHAFSIRIPTAGRDEERWFAATGNAQSNEFDEFNEERLGKGTVNSSNSSNLHDSDFELAAQEVPLAVHQDSVGSRRMANLFDSESGSQAV